MEKAIVGCKYKRMSERLGRCAPRLFVCVIDFMYAGPIQGISLFRRAQLIMGMDMEEQKQALMPK